MAMRMLVGAGLLRYFIILERLLLKPARTGVSS